MRCGWAERGDALLKKYHDEQWGVLVTDDAKLFEMLILESFHCGLSWRIILGKRAAFQAAFDHFDAKKIAAYDEKKIAELLKNEAIVRNEAKIRATVVNARVFLAICEEYGSFLRYLNEFTGGKIQYTEQSLKTTACSDALSRDLKKRGFRFMGSVTTQSWLEAVGWINAHEGQCFRYEGERK